MNSPIETLRRFCLTLEHGGIRFCVGGSGLLYFLKLRSFVNDWDLMTDDPWEKVKPCLGAHPHVLKGHRSPYASQWLCKIDVEGVSFDLIGGFGVETPTGVRRYSALVERHQDGIPLAGVSQWVEIYSLTGHPEKARLLSTVLQK